MPFGERLISSSANNSFTRRDNAEAIFSKVDKVGLAEASFDRFDVPQGQTGFFR